MNNYRIISDIGAGAYSTVHKAISYRTGQIVAIKIISEQTFTLSYVIKRQINLLKQCSSHTNIIRLIEHFIDNQLKRTYLVFEYMGMDLITFYKSIQHEQNRNLTDHEVSYIIYQICNGLYYLHSQRIMHRDIKPENVLIDPIDMKVKLCDFGFAKYQKYQQQQNTQYMVTRWYRPMEVVLGLPYDHKIDVFSVGSMMLELYLGHEIFRSVSNLDQFYWIINVIGFPQNWAEGKQAVRKLGLLIQANNQAQLILTFPSLSKAHLYHPKDTRIIKKLTQLIKTLKPSAQNIIEKMLKTSPKQRVSIEQVMNHSYFSTFRLKTNLIISETYENKSLIQKENTKKMNFMMNNLRGRTYSLGELNHGIKGFLRSNQKKQEYKINSSNGFKEQLNILSHNMKHVQNKDQTIRMCKIQSTMLNSHYNILNDQQKGIELVNNQKINQNYKNVHLEKDRKYERTQIRSLNQGIHVISLKKIKIVRNFQNDQKSRQKLNISENINNLPLDSNHTTKKAFIQKQSSQTIKLNHLNNSTKQLKININNLNKINFRQKLNKPMFLRIKQKINQGMNHSDKVVKSRNISINQTKTQKTNQPIKLKPRKIDIHSQHGIINDLKLRYNAHKQSQTNI